MSIVQPIFRRAAVLLGEPAMERLAQRRVIIFGVGGVGSWCAEALVRTGVHHLTIVDFDRVDVTNVNRQLMATTQTVGQPKVDALREGKGSLVQLTAVFGMTLASLVVKDVMNGADAL